MVCVGCRLSNDDILLQGMKFLLKTYFELCYRFCRITFLPQFIWHFDTISEDWQTARTIRAWEFSVVLPKTMYHLTCATRSPPTTTFSIILSAHKANFIPFTPIYSNRILGSCIPMLYVIEFKAHSHTCQTLCRRQRLAPFATCVCVIKCDITYTIHPFS